MNYLKFFLNFPKRPSAAPSISDAFGLFFLDLTKPLLLWDRKPVVLRFREYELLVLLVTNCDQTLSKDDALQRVWTDV